MSISTDPAYSATRKHNLAFWSQEAAGQRSIVTSAATSTVAAEPPLLAPCRIAVTSNITLSGEQTLQSIALVDGDRVLVAGQTSSVDNDVYIVSSGSWARAADDVIVPAALVAVQQGDNADTLWMVASDTIDRGVDPIVFAMVGTSGTGTNNYYAAWTGPRSLGIARLQNNYSTATTAVVGQVGDTKPAFEAGLPNVSYIRNGLVGYTGQGFGVYGETVHSAGVGVRGYSSESGYYGSLGTHLSGVYGYAANGLGIFAETNTGVALQAVANGVNPAIDALANGSGYAISANNTSTGVSLHAAKGSGATGNVAKFENLNASNTSETLRATSASNGIAGYFNNSGTGSGLWGLANTGAGVTAWSTGGGYSLYVYGDAASPAKEMVYFLVNGTSFTRSAVLIENKGTGETLKLNSVNGAPIIRAFQNTTEHLTLANSGKMGVGITSPSYRVDIQETGTAGGLQVQTAGTSGIAARAEITNSSNSSDCVYGLTAGNGAGVKGTNTGSGDGLFGSAAAAAKSGCYGQNSNAAGYGIYGKNTSHNSYGYLGGPTVGCYGESAATSGNAGVFNLAVTGTSTTSAYNILIGQYNGTNKWRVDNTGKTFQNGGSQASGADFAELVDIEGDLASYEPGDVLVISTASDRTFTKCGSIASTAVAGVVSTFPGFVGSEQGWDEEDLAVKIEMAVVGIVPVRVTDAGGAIARGDMLITSALPGHAQAAGASPAIGTIIGKALQPHTTGDGVISVLINAL